MVKILLTFFAMIYASFAYAEATAPSLRLEAGVEGKKSLYPGERTKLFYRYYFIGNIALTSEDVPLLKAEGLGKIGELEIHDSVDGITSVREVSQVVEALKPGKFSFGPSEIQGVAYEQVRGEKPKPISGKLTGKAPAVEIQVLPFPESGRPSAFKGAVGRFSFSTKVEGNKDWSVGEEIPLKLEIIGKGASEDVPLPDLRGQPGFQGFFRISDLPPKVVMNGNTRSVEMMVRPLSERIVEIPRVEFAYFDPDSAKYVVLHSAAIPIRVKGEPKKVDAQPKVQQNGVGVPKKSGEVTPATPLKPAEIEITKILPIDSRSLHNLLFGTWWVVAVIPCGIALILYQLQLREALIREKNRVIPMDGYRAFKMAQKELRGSSHFYEAIERALKISLKEHGWISSEEILDDAIPKIGLAGEVRQLISEINLHRFATGSPMDDAALLQRTKALIDRIYRESKPTGGDHVGG